MKLMLASLDVAHWKNVGDLAHYCKYMLLSFFYMEKNNNPEVYDLMLKRNAEDRFMLDSGAFTLMMTEDTNLHQNLDDYIDRYIAFIKKYQIKRYVEMDIDSVIGYEAVKEVREKLEAEIGYQSIPVWHKNRGIEDYKKTVDEYGYIAFGGFNDIGSENVTIKDYPEVKKMIQYANHRRVKVHGLGFTRKDAYEYGFYSVDSASWRSGSRYGNLVEFKGGRMQRIEKPENTRVNYKMVDRHNLIEWCKYQRSVENKFTEQTGIRFKYRFVISLLKKLEENVAWKQRRMKKCETLLERPLSLVS